MDQPVSSSDKQTSVAADKPTTEPTSTAVTDEKPATAPSGPVGEDKSGEALAPEPGTAKTASDTKPDAGATGDTAEAEPTAAVDASTDDASTTSAQPTGKPTVGARAGAGSASKSSRKKGRGRQAKAAPAPKPMGPAAKPEETGPSPVTPAATGGSEPAKPEASGTAPAKTDATALSSDNAAAATTAKAAAATPAGEEQPTKAEPTKAEPTKATTAENAVPEPATVKPEPTTAPGVEPTALKAEPTAALKAEPTAAKADEATSLKTEATPAKTAAAATTAAKVETPKTGAPKTGTTPAKTATTPAKNATTPAKTGATAPKDADKTAVEATAVHPAAEPTRTRVIPAAGTMPSRRSQRAAAEAASRGGTAPISGAPTSGAPGVLPSNRPAWQPMNFREPSAGRRGLTVFGVTLTRRQTAIGIAILAAVLLLVGLLVPLAFAGEDDNAGADGGQQNGTTPATSVAKPQQSAAAAPAPQTTAPEPTPSSAPPSKAPTSADVTTAAVALPKGWRVYGNAGTGFSVPLPADVSVEERSQETHFRYDNRLLIIAQTDRPAPDPMADWKQQEASRSDGKYRNYQRIKMVPVDYFQKGVDWEFLYTTSTGNPQHAVKRNFLTGPKKAYSINWYTSPGDWNAAKKDLQVIYDGFKPLS